MLQPPSIDQWRLAKARPCTTFYALSSDRARALRVDDVASGRRSAINSRLPILTTLVRHSYNVLAR